MCERADREQCDYQLQVNTHKLKTCHFGYAAEAPGPWPGEQ